MKIKSLTKFNIFQNPSIEQNFRTAIKKKCIPPTSYVGMTTRLALFVAQSEKVEKCSRLQWHKVYTKFNENPSTGQNVIKVR